MIELRIHHFFDVLRDYGADKELTPHKYGHSYHLVGEAIYSNRVKEFRIVIGSDDICVKCSKLEDGRCTDLIDHREDFDKKEEFNNYLDARILRTMNLEPGQIVQVEDILVISQLYVDNIFDIYLGNSGEHTEERRKNVILGIEKKKRELRRERQSTN